MPRSRKLLFAVIFILVGVVTWVVCLGWNYGEDVTGELDLLGKTSPAAVLMPGLGALHHPISRSSAPVQQFFDQGLTLVYAFNFAEAVRSFQRAAQLDPRSPMPYWGIALARGPNFNSGVLSDEREEVATIAIEKAKSLEANASPEERAYIEALLLRVSDDEGADHAKMAVAYSHAMGELYRANPQDPDAGALYAESLMDLHAWRLWRPDGTPEVNTEEILRVLREVLMSAPDHLGANHYLVHALEASPHPEDALPSARLLPSLAPLAGHIVHMPAHIFFRIGDYPSAERANLAGIAADEKYFASAAVANASYRAGYEDHNYRFLAAAAEMDGDFDTAMSAAKTLASAQGADRDADAAILYFASVRFGRWGDILALPPPDRSLMAANYFWHYARACAAAATGNTGQAQSESVAMATVLARIPRGGEIPTLGSWDEINQLASGSVNARTAFARGDQTSAAAQWSALINLEDTIGYREPPAWYPVRESAGAELLLTGDPIGAEAIFREDLRRNRLNPRSLLGLAFALEAQHKSVEAAEFRQQFATAWKGATTPRLEDY